MRKSFLILSIPLLILAACSFNPKVVPIGDDYLQGNWEELFSVENDQLVSYERYAFKITCDSFYLDIDSYSKVNLEGGECYNDNKWKEYVKGTYHVKDDSLYLKGAFVNNDYRYKPESSCYRFGVYEENFRITKLGTDSILINNSSFRTSFGFKRKNKV
jgi:hypothetical protein